MLKYCAKVCVTCRLCFGNIVKDGPGDLVYKQIPRLEVHGNEQERVVQYILPVIRFE